ncbi:MAG: hypothetical protein C0613_02970 [Desulfobulbaceae bacterium]|nr:MAG: hypothetical protein C0613_02970 [Desulfobulbaceae bacterium]
MPSHTLRTVAAALLVLTLLVVSGTPVVTAALTRETPVDSCCYPTDGHDEPAQPCDTTSGCSCLFCLHIDLQQTSLFSYRPQAAALPFFPIPPSLPADFSRRIDYPPESC